MSETKQAIDALNLVISFNPATGQFEVVRETADKVSRLTTNLQLADILVAIAERHEDGIEYMSNMSRSLASLQKLLERRVSVLKAPQSKSVAEEFLADYPLTAPNAPDTTKVNSKSKVHSGSQAV